MLGYNGSVSLPDEEGRLAQRIGDAMLCIEPGHFVSVASIAALLGSHSLSGPIAARLNTRASRPMGHVYPDFVVPVRVNGTLGAIRITVDPSKTGTDHD